MLFFLGYILPYFAAAVFVTGMAWQSWRWLKTPAPFPLTLLPAAEGRARPIAAAAGELVVFRSLLRGDRTLWFCAWLMHVTLALIIVGHLAGIGLLARQFCCLGLSPESSVLLSKTSGTILGLLMAAALAMLLWRRTAIPEVRRLSGPSDYFDVALLMAVVLSGLYLRLSPTKTDLGAVRAYLAGLLRFQPVPLPERAGLIVHFTLVNLLLVYFPFSKLVHLTGALVSRTLVEQPPPVYPTPAGRQRTARFLRRRGSTPS